MRLRGISQLAGNFPQRLAVHKESKSNDISRVERLGKRIEKSSVK
jgi:hypothetical protein